VLLPVLSLSNLVQADANSLPGPASPRPRGGSCLTASDRHERRVSSPARTSCVTPSRHLPDGRDHAVTLRAPPCYPGTTRPRTDAATEHHLGFSTTRRFLYTDGRCATKAGATVASYIIRAYAYNIPSPSRQNNAVKQNSRCFLQPDCIHRWVGA
jgi:hypothetical protein